ncbi:coniferyl aldehyde dehydrogenase [Microbulbifer agarilyticus]
MSSDQQQAGEHLVSDIEAIALVLQNQKLAFGEDRYPSYESRIADLCALKAILLNNQERFIESLSQDFGYRCSDDTRIGDLLTTVSGINYTLKRLKKWMKPARRHVGLLFQPASARVLYQPLGVVGIMVPWNYPLFLSLGPLTTALAAGNRAMIKMSEATPRTNALLAELIAEYFPPSKVSIIGGEADMARAFSSLSFDHLIFTGSTNVGREVMKAAAENLVPVTLELGGKSPAVIDRNMSVKTAVERMMLGKTLNSGQTCVAPDYVFCPRGRLDELVEEFRAVFSRIFPAFERSPDYTSVVNDAHFSRLKGLLSDAESRGARIVPLAESGASTANRKLPLTLVLNPTSQMACMQQEIFGPLLPIVEYDTLDEVCAAINAQPRPLALYIYSFDKSFQNTVLKHTHAGGVCINDAAFHVANEDLPFGGVGESGIGQYHGFEGFQTFSNAKSILSRGRISFAKLLFPPYGKFIHKLVYKLFIR